MSSSDRFGVSCLAQAGHIIWLLVTASGGIGDRSQPEGKHRTLLITAITVTMSEGEAVGGTEPITELECHESHPDGHVSAAWLGTDAQVLAVVTAGRDGMLARRQFRPPAEPKTTRMTKGDAGINVMELNADSTMAVIGVNSTGGSDVKVIPCFWHFQQVTCTPAEAQLSRPGGCIS
jgi:hypothetical protein